MDEIKLYPCKNWDFFNGCCIRKVKKLEQIGELGKVNLSEDDFYKDCKGSAKLSLCCWFVYRASTVIDIQREVKRYGVKHGS